MKLYERPQVEARGKTLIHDERIPVALFPSYLPWHRPPGKSRGRRGSRSHHRRVALEWLRCVWGLFNFLEGGSPCSPQAGQHVVTRAMSGVWTATHECYARAMYKKLVSYVSHPRETMERGTATLNELISRITHSKYDPSISLEQGLSGAKQVDPSRISLPEVAAVLDPKDHLKGERLKDFSTMSEWVPTDLPYAIDPKPCHKVLPADWAILLRKLHDAKMIEFLPIEEVLHEGVKVIRGGLFCVPHKPDSDRLINDRRPLNIREHRLGWCELPAGHMLKQLILEPSQSVRCSGDDLSNYFYLIKHLDAWLHRNCFGDPIKGDKLKGLGLDPKRKYLPAFRVVCMGDLNGVDIAQGTHEALLESAGCLQPHQKLVYGKVFPPSNTIEGLYIDDHLVLQVVNNKGVRSRDIEADEILTAASRDQYKKLGLPTSEKKAINKEYDFKASGTSVHSQSGRVGTPLKKLKQIEQLTCQLLAEGRASKKALQQLVGLYVHPFMHRRECMSMFHHIYVFLEKLPEQGIKRLPQFIRDELVCAVLLLPLAEANIRAPVSVQLSATDASSKKGGRAVSLTSKSFARTLYRHAESKGEHVRLDWDQHSLQPPSEMTPAPPVLVEALQGHHWTASQSMTFERKEHINILELEMVKQEIKCRANSNKGHSRVVNLCDSRVVVGCFGKGRSSSRSLNHKLRSCVPWLLTSDLQLVNLWVPTDKNPADFPSRGKQIPPPSPDLEIPLLDPATARAVRRFRSLGVQSLGETESRLKGVDPVYAGIEVDPESNEVHECITSPSEPLLNCPEEIRKPIIPEVTRDKKETPATVVQKGAIRRPRPYFREIFAGKARLSQRVGLTGTFRVLEPLEYMEKGSKIEAMNMLRNDVYARLKEDAKRPGQVWHFGLPCSSFSIIQHSNQGTRRKSRPEGLGTLSREIEGNVLLKRTLRLIDILTKSGNHWSVENPLSSYVWCMPDMLKKLDGSECISVTLDQCSYGLRLPNKEGILGPCKKATRIVGNLPGLEKLHKKCTCEQPHVHAIGGVRTRSGWKRRSELAGHYPISLCDSYAQIAKEAWERQNNST